MILYRWEQQAIRDRLGVYPDDEDRFLTETMLQSWAGDLPDHVIPDVDSGHNLPAL